MFDRLLRTHDQGPILSSRPRWTFLAFMIAYALVIRLLPYVLHGAGVELNMNVTTYPWNFTPLFAIFLFGGTFFRDRGAAIAFPLATMLASDLSIWALTGRRDMAFYPSQFAVYFSLALCAVVGFWLRDDRNVVRTSLAGFLGCTLFFLITNFVHWIALDTFPKTIQGLALCYAAGLPSYRNSLLGTALFGSLLFSPLGLRAVAARNRAAVVPSS